MGCLPFALVLLILPLAGCRATLGGGTTIRVPGATRTEEDAIRLQEWRIERAAQQVIVAYGLEGLDLEIVLEEEGGLGKTRPRLDAIAEVDGATVSINRRLFLDDPPASDDVLLGLFAHELAHALHYAHMSEVDLVVFAERYGRFYLDPQGDLRAWAAAYERLTDLTAIAYGYAEPLIAQKIASKDNVARHHPKKVWDFYLEPEEIAELAGDPSALRSRIDAAAAVVGLFSLERFVATLPVARAGDS
jgi:hypothetical protein